MMFKTQSGEVALEDLSTDDLNWYADECKGKAKSDAAKAERDRRKNGGVAPAPTPTPSTALAKAPDVQLVTGSFRHPERATDALRQASAIGHLVAPAPVCGSIPEGCALALSAVMVDANTETYEVSGKRGLSKVALDKIAAAAGISWDPHLSRRMDNASDPHYCHYKAVGRVRDFDGTVRVVQGEVEMDARDGSPQLAGFKPNQTTELRKFLLRHAESKAKNRAIRSLGVRTAYAREELAKPFVVAKVQFTGETNDPELRKMFAEKTADAFLGAQGALYGAPLETPALPPAGDGTHAPPPVGAVPVDDAAITAHGTASDDEDDDSPPPRQQKLSGIDPAQDRGADPNRY